MNGNLTSAKLNQSLLFPVDNIGGVERREACMNAQATAGLPCLVLCHGVLYPLQTSMQKDACIYCAFTIMTRGSLRGEMGVSCPFFK